MIKKNIKIKITLSLRYLQVHKGGDLLQRAKSLCPSPQLPPLQLNTFLAYIRFKFIMKLYHSSIAFEGKEHSEVREEYKSYLAGLLQV